MIAFPRLFREPERNPALARALASVEPPSAEGEERLVARIMAAARSPRVRSEAWWETITGWMPVTVPMVLAASVAALLALPARSEVVARSGASAPSADAAVDSAFGAAVFSGVGSSGAVAAELVTVSEDLVVFSREAR